MIDDALRRLLAAHAAVLTSDRPADQIATELAAAEAELARAITDERIAADLRGRADLLDRLGLIRHTFADRPVAQVDRPTFSQAVRAILRRVPRLARTARQVAQVHATGGIAFARAASVSVAQFVRDTLASVLRAGETRVEFDRLVREALPWTRSYAETVYRTNLASAYTEGQIEQATDPDVAELVVGFRFVAVLDADTRPNHAACHGLVARVDDPVWARARPPLGYNCRCDLIPVTRDQAKRERLLRGGVLPWARLPAGAGPDPGFRP